MTLVKLRVLGIHLLLLCAVTGGAIAASLSLARVPLATRVPNFPDLPLRPQEGALDPVTMAAWGLPVGPPIRHLPRRRERRAAIHTIVVSATGITLRAGGQVIATIRSRQRSMNLARIVRAVANPAWISEPAPGVVRLRAALIVQNGASLTVSPPSARLLLLADRNGVFLGAVHATLLIRSATVESPRPRYTGAYRPFVLAEAGSRLAITHSRLAGLGWNWDNSYGVSWKDGSTGGATDSTFVGNYFGLYTGEVSGLLFNRNVVTGSYSYGLDPHSGSSGLTITNNTVTGNGRHGIILANHVTGSTVADNTVGGNAANGIMAYQGSGGNLIEGNTVAGNHGDGLVLAGSPGNRVIGNKIRGNRVGLHFTGTPPATVKLSGNIVTGNALNVEGVRRRAGNVVASDIYLRWNADWLAVIWVLGTVLTTVTLMSLTSCLLSDREAG